MLKLLPLIFLFSLDCYAQELSGIQFYESREFMIQQNIKQVKEWAHLRIQKIKEMNLIDARKMSKKNLHLISWPDENKMIYRYGEIILKDRYK
jgi:hypothetical protein